MIDIRQLRKNEKAYRRAIQLKGIELDLDRLLEVANQFADLNHEIDRLREDHNKLIKMVMNSGEDKHQLIVRSKTIAELVTEKEILLKQAQSSLLQLSDFLPGIPADDVPIGESDSDNKEVRKVGVVKNAGFALRDHLELAKMHNLVDFEGARQAAGSRAYGLTGMGALLENAVIRLAMDKLTAKGFQPVLPPLMVKESAMHGTGYFPLGQENAYLLEKDQLYLTGTSEVGIVAMQMNRTFQLEKLPMRYVGVSTCFRREAGSAGKDTRGLYRVHQFQKVEQIVFCVNDPEVSQTEHTKLLANSEELLQALELPYRVVAVCTGDMGLGQVRKHDIETWMPSRNQYGETHSCSTFHDFQSRRLMIRYETNREKHFVHTLNNTAIASPRILIPLLENHQNEDGSINIPAALRPYLGGIEVIDATTNKWYA